MRAFLSGSGLSVAVVQFGSVIALLFLFSLPQDSHAGIAEYNAAASSGDYVAAARETAEAWENYDKSRADAVAIVREFAFVNYLAGDFEEAAGLMDNLLDDDSELSSRDDQPQVSRVLSDLIAINQESSVGNRNALFQSLQARLPEEVDNISILAARALYLDDWTQGRLEELESSSALALSFFERAGEEVLVDSRRAELLAAAAEFMRWRNVPSYDQFVDLHNAIVADVDRVEDDGTREALISLKWLADAWSQSAWTYLDNDNPQLGSHIDRVKPRELAGSTKGYFYRVTTAADNPLPPCETRLDWTVYYPPSAAYNQLIGTVIIKMDFDEDGRVEKHSLLASVPADSFGKGAIDRVSSARLRALRGQDTDKCTLAVKGYVVTINFRL